MSASYLFPLLPLCVLLCSPVSSTHNNVAWSESCDPWNTERPIETGDYTNCPPELQSVSGCGDFLGDPRNETCEETKTFDKDCSRRYVHTMQEPAANLDDSGALPLNDSHIHVCIDEQIEYEVQRYALPVSAGQHRERWAQWGQYEYLPQTRWVHNIEHSTVAFLYNHCLSEEDVCKLKSYILSWAGDITGPFRWVLSPAPLGRLNSGSQDRLLGIAVWGHVLLTDCWNTADFDTFIRRHYRWTTPEDFPLDGFYNHTYLGVDACPGYPPEARRVVEDTDFSGAGVSQKLTDQQAVIDTQQATIKALSAGLDAQQVLIKALSEDVEALKETAPGSSSDIVSEAGRPSGAWGALAGLLLFPLALW